MSKNDNVIDIDCFKPHYTNELICINCKYRWIGVYKCKTALNDLICPKCKKSGFVILTGQVFDENGHAI